MDEENADEEEEQQQQLETRQNFCILKVDAGRIPPRAVSNICSYFIPYKLKVAQRKFDVLESFCFFKTRTYMKEKLITNYGKHLHKNFVESNKF